jgi:hypothetical protein
MVSHWKPAWKPVDAILEAILEAIGSHCETSLKPMEAIQAPFGAHPGRHWNLMEATTSQPGIHWMPL